MKLIVESENRIRFEMAGEDFDLSSEGPALSPYHLLGGSLASCTALILQPWAQAAKIEIDSLSISVGWEVTDDRPKLVSRLSMELRWPDLPSNRLATAERVADLCLIHATLKRGTGRRAAHRLAVTMPQRAERGSS